MQRTRYHLKEYRRMEAGNVRMPFDFSRTNKSYRHRKTYNTIKLENSHIIVQEDFLFCNSNIFSPVGSLSPVLSRTAVKSETNSSFDSYLRI